MFVPEKAMPQKLCVVGLGLMGTVLAAKLVRAGYEVRGYDIDKERMSLLEENGGTPAESPAGAAAGAAFPHPSDLEGRVSSSSGTRSDGALR